MTKLEIKELLKKDVKQVQRDYSKRYYYLNHAEQKRRQEKYRYPNSVQKLVDNAWESISKYDGSKLRSWAIVNGFADGCSPSRFIAFWRAVKRNKKEGVKAVKNRIEQMATFHANKKTKKKPPKKK